MSFGQSIAFNIALVAAILSPGPALLYALRATLAGGRRAGLLAGTGLALMASGWTLLALLGLAGVFHAVPIAYVAVKTLGAIYLVTVAWCLWRDAGKPPGRARGATPAPFSGGVLVNLANPKSVLFAAAILVVIFPPDLTTGQKLLIVGNHFAVELIIYALLARVMSTEPVVQRYLRARVLVDRAAGMVLAGLGVSLLLDER